MKNSMKIFFCQAIEAINNNCEILNSINYFPVPDKDTGSNILYTLDSVYKTVDFDNPVHLLKEQVISLLDQNSRGNSGIIISQILNGFISICYGVDTHSPELIHKGFVEAKLKAYNAVFKPCEGTVLSVLSAICQVPNCEDFNEYLGNVYQAALDELENTKIFIKSYSGKSLVDAGARGFVIILQCLLNSFFEFETPKLFCSDNNEGDIFSENKYDDSGYIYCAELLIILHGHFSNKSENIFIKKLTEIGNSINLVKSNKFIKLHIHTNAPDKVIAFALTFGVVDNVKIDNMNINNKHSNC